MTALFIPRDLEPLVVPDQPAEGTVSVGWDLGDARFGESATVTVIEVRPEGVLNCELLVGDKALEWLRLHVPEALVAGAPKHGHATFTSLDARYQRDANEIL